MDVLSSPKSFDEVTDATAVVSAVGAVTLEDDDDDDDEDDEDYSGWTTEFHHRGGVRPPPQSRDLGHPGHVEADQDDDDDDDAEEDDLDDEREEQPSAPPSLPQAAVSGVGSGTASRTAPTSLPAPTYPVSGANGSHPRVAAMARYDSFGMDDEDDDDEEEEHRGGHGHFSGRRRRRSSHLGCDDYDDDEEEEETKFESFEKLCNVGDLLHPFPGTSNGKAEEGTIDVSSTCELLLSDIEKNGDFAASFDASNLRQTANADVSLYNEIMGRLVACPDVNNENEFIECSTGTTRTELDKFTLLRIRIAHEIDAKHRDVQWWKDSVANKHFQKSSLEHLIALIQVMLDVQEWRVISADRIGFLQSKFNVEDDILSIGQELKGVWERVDRSLARDQFRLFGEDGFERHLATATMVDALEQSCREAVISFAV
mmetsp:Transcript_2971/g.6228  ORF Transcript_2971/g.6228 Transcript_2971/m.6228 type:complete len:428 (-) Transcript_2971:217-1500(-)